VEALLLIQERKGVAPSDEAHLLESFHGNERRERFPLSLDYKLVVSQGDPIQHVAKPLPHFKRRNLFAHGGQLL
jgi:hypothetical protein